MAWEVHLRLARRSENAALVSYEVGVSPDRLQEFDDYLAELGYWLGQKAIWRVVYEGGAGNAIRACPARRRRRK